MELVKYVKVGAVIAVVLYFIIRTVLRARRSKNQFYQIRVDQSHTNFRVAGSVRAQTDSIIATPQSMDESRDDRAYQLYEQLIEPLQGLIKATDEQVYFNALNTPQRVFYLAMEFDGQVNNGGVYQFVWNRPPCMFAMHEALKALGMDTLAADYAQVLKELEQHADDYAKDRQYWNDPSVSHEDKWNRFSAGRRYIPTGKTIEDYFYEPDFKMKWHQAMVDYVRDHMDAFVEKA